MSFLPTGNPDYEGFRKSKSPKVKARECRTKQAFKDSTDINKLLVKGAREGTLSHLQKYQGQYGDFSDFDFQGAQNQLAQASTMFEELPAEVRREFGQSPEAFFKFVNDPENMDKLAEKVPALAKAGTQLPNVNRSSPATPDANASPEGSETPSGPSSEE